MWRTGLETANVFESSRNHLILKGHLRNHNRISNRDSYVYRTSMIQIYKPATRNTVVKTDSPNFYSLRTCIALVKTDCELVQATCALYGGQNGLSKLAVFVHDLTVVKKDSPSFHKDCTRLAMVKTVSTNFYMVSKRFMVVKTNSLSFDNSLARFALVKTACPNFYKVSTRFVVVKTDTVNHLHALRWSKPTLRTSTRLLRALRWSKRYSTVLVHDLRRSKRTLRVSTSPLRVVKTDYTSFYSSRTRYALVKTDFPSFYSPRT